MKDLVEGVLAGNERAAARLIRLADDGDATAFAALDELHAHTGNAYVLGVTGNPGSGKSTLVDQLTTRFRARDETVAIVAIDPTSPFSGGAILGDRVRMGRHSTDEGVFIRSVATRGNLGGISRSTPAIMEIFDAMGFDWIIVETVGVGQDEVDVAAFADTCAVVVVPGLGDGVQAAKAGVFEIADVFVVNKADRAGADRVKRDVNAALDLEQEGRQRPAVVDTVATTGEGVDELVAAIDDHRATRTDQQERRLRRARYQTRLIAAGELLAAVDRLLDSAKGSALVADVEAGGVSPFGAAQRLVEWVTREP